MATILDRVLEEQSTNPPAHPRLRNWAAQIAGGGKLQLEVYRPTAVFGSTQTEMNLHLEVKAESQLLETVIWDDDLNAGLIQLGVRSIDVANESERFALGLRAALRKAGREFGDGHFNAILFEIVTESELTHNPEIADILKHAYAPAPNRESRNYNLCREMIADAIVGRKYELENRLGYGADEARQILLKALARYLDERFTVSSRRRLGLL